MSSIELTEYGDVVFGEVDEYGNAVFDSLTEYGVCVYRLFELSAVDGITLSDTVSALYTERPAALPAPHYTLELRDSSDNLVAILHNAYAISYERDMNRPAILLFALPTGDTKASLITHATEICLRNYDTGEIVEKFKLNIREDEQC